MSKFTIYHFYIPSKNCSVPVAIQVFFAMAPMHYLSYLLHILTLCVCVCMCITASPQWPNYSSVFPLDGVCVCFVQWPAGEMRGCRRWHLRLGRKEGPCYVVLSRARQEEGTPPTQPAVFAPCKIRPPLSCSLKAPIQPRRWGRPKTSAALARGTKAWSGLGKGTCVGESGADPKGPFDGTRLRSHDRHRVQRITSGALTL